MNSFTFHISWNTACKTMLYTNLTSLVMPLLILSFLPWPSSHYLFIIKIYLFLDNTDPSVLFLCSYWFSCSPKHLIIVLLPFLIYEVWSVYNLYNKSINFFVDSIQSHNSFCSPESLLLDILPVCTNYFLNWLSVTSQ